MLKNILWGAILCGAAPGLLQAATDVSLREENARLHREHRLKVQELYRAEDARLQALQTFINTSVKGLETAAKELEKGVQDLAFALTQIDVTITTQVELELSKNARAAANLANRFENDLRNSEALFATKQGGVAYSDLSFLATLMSAYNATNVLSGSSVGSTSTSGTTATTTTAPTSTLVNVSALSDALASFTDNAKKMIGTQKEFDKSIKGIQAFMQKP